MISALVCPRTAGSPYFERVSVSLTRSSGADEGHTGLNLISSASPITGLCELSFRKYGTMVPTAGCADPSEGNQKPVCVW